MSSPGGGKGGGGGKKGGGSTTNVNTPPPAIPTTGQTAAVVQEQGRQNRLGQITPQGNLEFGTTDAQGNFTVDPSLSAASSRITETPFQQEFRGVQEETGLSLAESGRESARNLPSGPQDLSGLVQLPGVESGFGDERSRVEGAVFERAQNLLNPQFERQERLLRSDLANRGQPIATGTAGGQEFDIFNEQRNRAFTDAALQSILAGGQEQSRLFGQAGQARNQQFGEQQAVRSGQFNELQALLGGQQVAPSQLPQFQLPAPSNVLGATAIEQARLNTGFNTGNANQQAYLNNLFGLGASIGSSFASS